MQSSVSAMIPKPFHRPLGLQRVYREIPLSNSQRRMPKLPSAKASDDHSAA